MFSRGPDSAGLGVGLALARKLVEMHGGAIEAYSAGEGCGSEFTVTLPLAAPGTQPLPATSVSAPVNGLRVVVADDNRDAADTLGVLLRALGNEVSVAYDGIEAVEMAREFRPHVIMLDMGMPRLDGYGAAREIRRDAGIADVKLVALTGWGQDDDRKRAQDAGFDVHLVKPADLDAVRRVLADARRSLAR
jgi:CheY-like chemotaxis protein